MPATSSTLATLGLADVISRAAPVGAGLFATSEMVQGLHHVLEQERPGTWRLTMKACGHPSGREIAQELDRALAAHQKPALAALPLEGCFALLEQQFALQGWGRLHVDLAAAAQHGLVIAQLDGAFFADTLTERKHSADAALAGVLQGFFEYITGQTLACEEIACARSGSAQCTFVIASPERLALVMPRLGHEPADAIIARLTQG